MLLFPATLCFTCQTERGVLFFPSDGTQDDTFRLKRTLVLNADSGKCLSTAPCDKRWLQTCGYTPQMEQGPSVPLSAGV